MTWAYDRITWAKLNLQSAWHEYLAAGELGDMSELELRKMRDFIDTWLEHAKRKDEAA